MNLFEIVKYGVSCREAAELYGMEVNRYGMALCPFHNDRHPSLYVADDHYYCFACGEHGDVIDFVGKLFQLSPYDAARKLMADFHLSPDKPPSAAALHAKRIRTEAQQLMENERLCFSVLSDYARVLRDWKVRYAPQSPDAPVHARFMEACHKLDETEYYLDILCVGDSHERAEVVQQQMQAVKNTVPAIAEAMEKIRSSILIFSYQLRHIGVGKHNMGKRVKAVKPELERYVGLVQQIKDKSKERKALLAEKKERPFYQIPKLHDLTRCITELTEELEELKTEKAMLLRSLDCADDVGISAVKKEIAALESALQKLSEQEEKYSAELDEALKQYAELKEQAAGMDAVELMDARLAVREEQERSVASRVKSAYGEKYDPMMMQDSKRDVANLLNEETEARSIRERLRQKQQAQQKQNKKKSRDRWER